MGPRSSRVIEVLRETILRAEQTPELGPNDPGVIELKRLLSQWVAQTDLVLKDDVPLLKDRCNTAEIS
jgi:hypothetical protein